jgi:hypothetical protein
MRQRRDEYLFEGFDRAILPVNGVAAMVPLAQKLIPVTAPVFNLPAV